MREKRFYGFNLIRQSRGQKIGRSVKRFEFLVSFMDQMKYAVHDVTNDDKPNIKIKIREFYNLQCWKNVKGILPTYILVPENK